MPRCQDLAPETGGWYHRQPSKNLQVLQLIQEPTFPLYETCWGILLDVVVGPMYFIQWENDVLNYFLSTSKFYAGVVRVYVVKICLSTPSSDGHTIYRMFHSRN